MPPARPRRGRGRARPRRAGCCRRRASGRAAARSGRHAAAATGIRFFASRSAIAACEALGCPRRRDSRPAAPRTRARAPGSRRDRRCRRRRCAARVGRRSKMTASAASSRRTCSAGASCGSSFVARMSPSGTGASSSLPARKSCSARKGSSLRSRRAGRSAPPRSAAGSPRSAGTVRARRAAPPGLGQQVRQIRNASLFVLTTTRARRPGDLPGGRPPKLRRDRAGVAAAQAPGSAGRVPARAQARPQAPPSVGAQRRREQHPRHDELVPRLRRPGSSGQSRSASATRTTPGGPPTGSGGTCRGRTTTSSPRPPGRARRAPRPGAGALLEQVEEQDRVRREQDRDEDRQARQVPLDDVRAALRGRREAHPAEAGVAAGVHQDQRR